MLICAFFSYTPPKIAVATTFPTSVTVSITGLTASTTVSTTGVNTSATALTASSKKPQNRLCLTKFLEAIDIPMFRRC